MSDRELLESAAKAYGVVIDRWERDGNGIEVAYYVNERGGHSPFHPLHENQFTDCMGDALRLAVKLGMSIDPAECTQSVFAGVAPSGGAAGFADELLGDDPYAATRRAIVRAAAEIGRGMG